MFNHISGQRENYVFESVYKSSDLNVSTKREWDKSLAMSVNEISEKRPISNKNKRYCTPNVEPTFRFTSRQTKRKKVT